MHITDVGISLQGKLIILISGIIFITFIFYLLKSRKISDSLGLVWLTVSIGMVLVMMNNTLLLFVTHLMGAKYPASALTMIGLFFVMALLLYFTLKLTKLNQDMRSFVQQMAMKNMELEDEIAKLKSQKNLET